MNSTQTNQKRVSTRRAAKACRSSQRRKTDRPTPKNTVIQDRSGRGRRGWMSIARMRRLLLGVVLSLWPVVALAQTGTILPSPKFYATDNNGLPCAGCLLFSYIPGTSNLQATYADAGLTTPNPIPVVLDGSGRATIFLAATSYKFVLESSYGAVLWTVDNVASIGLSTAAIGSELVVFAGQNNSPITATAYPVGTTYASMHAGTLIWSFNTINLVGTYALEGMCLGNGGTVSASLMNLSDGNPQTPMVTISSANSAGERQVSGAITFPAGGVSKLYGIKTVVTAGYGYCWALRLVRIS